MVEVENKENEYIKKRLRVFYVLGGKITDDLMFLFQIKNSSPLRLPCYDPGPKITNELKRLNQKYRKILRGFDGRNVSYGGSISFKKNK